MAELLYKAEVFEIIGAAIEVHKELGHGFLEAVYQEAIEIEMRQRQIPFEPQKNLCIRYKELILQKQYVADFICYGKIIVELKALDELTGREESQILNYLKATGLRVGLLINFGSVGKLEWKRYIK
ncbi:MAG TPA: GxxExxY protein [Bacteroidota bacterium]|nr:GxxExxY protein [Bacteroidota bacterium]